MLAIVNRVMQILALQEHERLWMVGPAWLSRVKGIGCLPENPRYTPLARAVQVGAVQVGHRNYVLVLRIPLVLE